MFYNGILHLRYVWFSFIWQGLRCKTLICFLFILIPRYFIFLNIFAQFSFCFRMHIVNISKIDSLIVVFQRIRFGDIAWMLFFISYLKTSFIEVSFKLWELFWPKRFVLRSCDSGYKCCCFPKFIILSILELKCAEETPGRFEEYI